MAPTLRCVVLGISGMGETGGIIKPGQRLVEPTIQIINNKERVICCVAKGWPLAEIYNPA